jgi:acyl carrier protein
LANIWADVLALAQVGVHDNFFDLGGHSLAASRVIARVIQTYKLEIPIKALFDAPTVAEMASLLTQNQANPASESELEHMLREVEAMTEEEVQRLVSESNSTIIKK